MPDRGKPSEFGGKVQKNGIQPQVPVALSPRGVPPVSGHEMTPSEELRQIYRTGTTDQTADPDPDAFVGGRDIPEQTP